MHAFRSRDFHFHDVCRNLLMSDENQVMRHFPDMV